MSGFVSALIKQRKDAKKSENTSGRLKEILAILGKYDYDDGITPQIVVSILQDLGPTFVKLGQIASQQSEQIPPEYCDALAQLRSSVAPMDMETVRGQIQKYLGKPVEELFASFDEKPLGSASIGQVHRATLEDGTVVAVKVRRPGVVETVARDFALIEKVLDVNSKFAKGVTGGLDVMSMVEELEHTSKLELDFTNEARNLQRFAENNAGRAGVRCPRCYDEYTNEAILTEGFVMGIEAADGEFLDTLSDDERDRLANLVADNFAVQVLTDGFYHADPHSGNVLICSTAAVESADETTDGETEGTTNEIEWIDFGMMGTLTTQERQTLLDLVVAEMKHDAYGLKKIVLQVATPQGDIDHGAMLELCETMCDQYTGKDFGDFGLSDLLLTVLDALQQENYRIDPFLTNLARGIIAAEGTVKALSPRVNILNNFTERVRGSLSLNLEDIDPRNIDLAGVAGPALMKLLQNLENTAELPTKTVEVLDMLEKGQIKVRSDLGFEDKGLHELTRLMRDGFIAVMAMALFIGSCIICVMPVDPSIQRVMGIPVLGFVGYLLGIGCMIYAARRIGKGR